MRLDFMKRWITGLLTVILSVVPAGCGSTMAGGAASPAASAMPDSAVSTPTPIPAGGTGAPAIHLETQPGVVDNGTGNKLAVTVIIGEETFAATLLDNETARVLGARLPLTLEMSELNGNEKYFYLDEGLPAAAEPPGRINAGDLMLYGSDCLVLFYETFSSGYSYTPVGSLDDPAGLAEAVGGGGVTVTFALA